MKKRYTCSALFKDIRQIAKQLFASQKSYAFNHFVECLKDDFLKNVCYLYKHHIELYIALVTIENKSINTPVSKKRL